MYYSEFPTLVSERIAYYVYLLIDPRNNNIFYIGKGKGNRLFHHVEGVLDSSNKSDKLELIREIQLSGNEVEYKILRHGLSEEMAFEVEAASIDLIGLSNLKNEVRGHDSDRGIKTLNELMSLYDSKPIERFDEPCLIITINRKYYSGISSEELYEATRGWWVIGEKRERVKFVLSTYNGIVREVYEVNDWEKVGKRCCFGGRIASDNIRGKYINRSLENFIKVGSQNPVKYTF